MKEDWFANVYKPILTMASQLADFFKNEITV
jgi:hypothetical protein